MAETSVRRLYVLLCGFEILPKTISTRGRGARFIMSEPISAYLLDTDGGWVLLDAGLNPDHVRNPASLSRYFTTPGFTPPVVRVPHELDRQLADIGITFSDIGHVILSHLHFDHSGYLHRLRHARISIQRRELEFALGSKVSGAYIKADYDLPDLNWDTVDGDWEPFAGLRMLDTRGHTEGHQSAVVELPNTGSIILPFDAGDLRENFDEEVLPGDCCDDEAALAAIRRLNRLESDTAGRMILFHDPVQIQTLTLAPDFYD